MAHRYRLVMKGGPAVGSQHELDSPLVSIGRYAGNTIAVADEQVSRHHARLTRTEEGYRVEDLGSVNGVFVNDQRLVAPRLLIPGDVLRLGKDIRFLYETFTAHEPIPAFAGVEPVAGGKVESARPERMVSDTGATVYQRAVELPQSRMDAQPKIAGVPWLWIILLVGMSVLVAVAIILFSGG